MQLYDKLGQTKFGDLTNVIEAYVEEERNGLFELELTYPSTYPLADKLEKENIIIANANDTLRSQKFRIYDTKKFLDGTITVFARHISFDLMYDIVNNVTFENQSCEYALNQLFRQSQFSTHYRGYSDIINAQDYSMSMCNILEAIGGKEGSIIDTYGTGAEILRDNTDISVLNRRGHDNGVSIEYAKNLTGFELEEDTTDLITRIIPFARYTDEASKEVIVKANAVDSPLINNYSHPYVRYIDFSDKFEQDEVPTTQRLTTLAQNEYRDKKVDIPRQNYKIEFIPLSKCVGYEGIEDKISLCDLVTIKNSQYNVDTQAKVIKYKFNVLTDRYESMELGEPKTSLGDIIGGGSGEGEQGPPGPQGPPGADGNIGDFPDSLPSKPVMSYTSYGLGAISLTWTYEDKAYYTYEVYASKTANFTPNFNDLIHEGQTSSYLFQAKPGETWYFKTCAKNSHGNRTDFSDQISVKVNTVDDFDEYFSSLAVSRLVADIFSVNYMEAGIIKGHWIDAKQLSVTDGNGKRTLDIDSYGNVNLDVNSLNIRSKSVATNESVTNIEHNLSSQIGGVSTKVETIQGDYVKNSQLTQLDNKFEYKFENSGKFNMLRNSVFSKDLKGWSNYNCLMAYGFSGCPVNQGVLLDDCSEHNQIRYIMQKLDIRSNSVGAYTFSGYVWMTYSDFIYGEGKEYPMANIYLVVTYSDDTNDWFNYDLRDNSKPQTWRKFKCTFENTKPVKSIEYYVYKRNCSGTMYVTQLKAEEGWEASTWIPSSNEIYTNITTIDGEGIEISHDGGAKSRLSHEAVEFTANNGNKVLRIKDGGMNFFTWNIPEMVGFIKPSSLANNRVYNGVSLSTYANGDYIAIGNSSSSDENAWETTPSILICKHNIPTDVANGYYEGINFYKRSLIWHPMFIKNKLDCDILKPIEFYGETPTNSQIYGSSGGLLNIMADNRINLGTRNGSATSQTALIIEEVSGWQNNSRIRLQAEFDFQNYKVHNFRPTYSLDSPAKINGEAKELHMSYTTNQGELRHSGKGVTVNYISKIELPVSIASNITDDYMVHLTKYGKGDIWIKEVNSSYFVVESDIEELRFNYEVVATELKVNTYNMNLVENAESAIVETPVNASYLDLTELNEEIKG